MTALKENDHKAAAAVFGMTVEGAESAFKALKERPAQLAAKYPSLLKPEKT
jgi:hypothetical protein